MLSPASAAGARHYDRVLDAWNLLLGSNLHYGCFDSGGETLEQATTKLTDRMVDALSVRAGARVLDIGCGTGEPALRLASRRGCDVVGISPSRACVRQAAARIPAALQQRVTFELGDAQKLHFADQSFDAAWALESSHLVPDKARLFAEAFRVLRPGSTFALCDVVLVRELVLPEVLARRDDFLLLHDVFGRAVMKTPAHYAWQAERHGFVLARQEELSASAAPTFDRWRRNAAASREAVCAHLGAAATQAFDRSLEVWARFGRDSVLGYFLMVAVRR